MANKFLFSSLFIVSTTFATNSLNNTLFQQFENQYNIGYGYSQGTLVNGAQNSATFSNQSINLEVERLFDMGLWMDVNFNTLIAYTQPNLGRLNGGSDGLNTANTVPGAPFGQNPFYFSINGRVGYAFNFVTHLQVIPYLLFGQNANWAASTINANGAANLSQSYFLSGGLGTRVVYRINNSILLFADGLYTYNWDNSGAIKEIQSAPDLYGKSYAATNYTFTTTLGAKFNVVKNLQLGTNVFWNNFQPQSNISGLMYTPTNTLGGIVSIGLTY
jgi:hypothetical protein